jgi:cell division protein FtsQ
MVETKERAPTKRKTMRASHTDRVSPRYTQPDYVPPIAHSNSKQAPEKSAARFWFQSLFWLSLMAALVWGLYQTYRWVAASYLVEQVEIQEALVHVNPEQVSSVLSPYLQQSLLALPLDQLRSELLALDWVEEVSLVRRWPDTLLVKINERQALALWENRAILDSGGKLIVLNEVNVDDLPIISSEILSSLLLGKSGGRQTKTELDNTILENSMIQSEVALLHARLTQVLSDRQNLPDDLGRLIQLRRDALGDWQLVWANGLNLRVTQSDFDSNMHALDVFLNNFSPQQRDKLNSIDLRYRNGFSVKLKSEQ